MDCLTALETVRVIFGLMMILKDEQTFNFSSIFALQMTFSNFEYAAPKIMPNFLSLASCFSSTAMLVSLFRF